MYLYLPKVGLRFVDCLWMVIGSLEKVQSDDDNGKFEKVQKKCQLQKKLTTRGTSNSASHLEHVSAKDMLLLPRHVPLISNSSTLANRPATNSTVPGS